MIIRLANFSDCKDLYNWRLDPITMKMFFNKNYFTYSSHKQWFNNNLNVNNTKIYIGTIKNEKIGVVIFKLKKEYSSISINLNPKFRGRGVSKKFLDLCISKYLFTCKSNLIAKIFIHNIASIKIFRAIGFKTLKYSKNTISLFFKNKNLYFEKIEGKKYQIKYLYDLLKLRKYNISHIKLPTFKSHTSFVNSFPYISWYLIFQEESIIGSVYLNRDNSIGLNLLKQNKKTVNQCLQFIKSSFVKNKYSPSTVPDYLYINTPFKNSKLSKYLIEFDCTPIQTSFKI